MLKQDILKHHFAEEIMQCLENADMRINALQSIIKRTIFKPLYFNFPVLDKYPMIFTSRRRAFAIMKEFEDLLYNLVRNRPRKLSRKEPVASQDELVVHMLERALEEGKITEEQFRANLKITFLTAHENTQQLLSSMFWKLGNDQVSIMAKQRYSLHTAYVMTLLGTILTLKSTRLFKTSSEQKCSPQASPIQPAKH